MSKPLSNPNYGRKEKQPIKDSKNKSKLRTRKYLDIKIGNRNKNKRSNMDENIFINELKVDNHCPETL